MIREFDPLSAYLLMIEYFWLHFLVVLGISALFTAISFLKSAPKAGTRVSWIASKVMSLVAFSSLGLVMAFFLSRGVNAEQKDQNPILIGAVAIIIPLITGAISYLEGAGDASGQHPRPRSGIAAFLLTCVISYQAFFYQMTHIYKA